MSRDTHARKKFYKLICQRDGEQCRVCKKIPPEVYLELDHIDGNKHHNPIDGSNYQLLCRKDNRKKNPRGKGKAVEVKRRVVMTSTYNEIIDQSRMSPEMYQNRKAEPKFRHWLYAKMKEKGRMPVQQIVNSGAEHASCSTYAIRTNYLPKLTSEEGLYVRFYDDVADCWMITFRNAAAIGNLVDAIDFELVKEDE